jgi:glycosyltransferase involved in cell wall biosynthesis
MKILHITKKYPNALGGDAIVVSNLERQQHANGDETVILTSNCTEIEDKPSVYKFGFKDTPAALDTITPRRLLSLGALVFKSFRVIRKERPDIIHTHSIDMAFAASFAARWHKIPMVHTFHILTFPDPHHGNIRRKSELFFLRGARPEIVTTPNQTDVNHLLQAGQRNARWLPNGIDLAFWRQQKNAHDVFTFITVARLEDQKGIEYLIRAVASLRKKTKKPFRLMVVGEGSQKDQLQLLAKELRVDKIVEFVGRKSPEEVRTLYAASDAVVVPSLWESGPLTVRSLGYETASHHYQSRCVCR